MKINQKELFRVNIETLTIQQIDDAIELLVAEREKAAAKIAEAAVKVKLLAESLGYTSAEDLLKAVQATEIEQPSGKVATKYMDPDNPNNKWSGRGKQPVWLRDALEGGATLEDFLVKGQDEELL